VVVLPSFTGVVLAGGAGGRMRLAPGQRKPEIIVAGEAMLDRVCAALAGADRIVVSGGTRAPAGALLVVEDPPGGGPVAGLAAALPLVGTPVVVLLAADLQLIDAGVVAWLRARLTGAGPSIDAVVAVDLGGRLQPLAAAYRSQALVAAVAAAAPIGRAVRDVLAGLCVMPLPSDAFWAKLVDVDTPEDLTAARVQAWAVHLATELDLPLDHAEVTGLVPVVLDLARDAAHGVARPAAPVTTFLAGVAIGARVAAGQPHERVAAAVADAVSAALRDGEISSAGRTGPWPR